MKTNIDQFIDSYHNMMRCRKCGHKNNRYKCDHSHSPSGLIYCPECPIDDLGFGELVDELHIKIDKTNFKPKCPICSLYLTSSKNRYDNYYFCKKCRIESPHFRDNGYDNETKIRHTGLLIEWYLNLNPQLTFNILIKGVDPPEKKKESHIWIMIEEYVNR